MSNLPHPPAGTRDSVIIALRLARSDYPHRLLGRPFLVRLQRLGISPASFAGFALTAEVDPSDTDFTGLLLVGICPLGRRVFRFIVHFYFSLSIRCAQDRMDGVRFL